MLTFEQIKELIGLVAENRLQVVEMERSGFRLKIEGHKAAVTADSHLPEAAAPAPALPPAAGGPAPETAVPAAAAGAPAAGTPAGAAPEVAPAERDVHFLTSPIVGTFYRRPSPDADPFVAVGDRVRPGQVLCIIEAMKLMNEIESDVAGVITEVFPQNAQPVEFEERLFGIRTD